MAESVVNETHASDINPSFSSEFDSIVIPLPPFNNFYNSGSDQASLENSISDLRFLLDGEGEFELTFDSVDDLYFPSENESFVIPVDATSREMSGDFTPGSGISGDCVNDKNKNENGVLSTSGCCNRESPRVSDCSGTAQSLSLSTQDSMNCASDVSEATIASSSPESGKVVVDPKFKLEEEDTTTSITKRKKEIEEDTSEESRSHKYRRSGENGAASVVTGGEEDDEKRNVRLIRNRESAQLSRQRKKHYVEELEQKVRNMQSTITDLNSKISYFMAENATLRQQVGSGNGMCQPHHQPQSPAGMYPPLAPMPYPWMSCPAYMIKPQGSQVPLLPIPRLKPQQSVVKVKKLGSKRSESKTKKVASVSVLGLLFCLFLFVALAPIVNVSFYSEGDSSYVADRVYAQSRGRVLDVNAHLDSDQGVGKNVSVTENSVPPGNGSEPLVASLFVPRNEKLVKIDGNLIIHSILASEKAMASETKNEGKNSLATTEGFSPALPLPDFTRTGDMSKPLDSKTRKALSKTASGKMQQWFREGVAGPMFSSGMCTEVFQFDVSSTSGPIIPASQATQQHKNISDTHKGKKNRRILRGGLPVSEFNLTKDQNGSSKENFRETKPGPSMVVSVLVDPREGGDGEIDGMMGGPKPLSRVFIVVLVDGVKYVTYSCVLPRPEVPHLVTT